MTRKSGNRFSEERDIYRGLKVAAMRALLMIIIVVVMALIIVYTGADKWPVDFPPQTEDAR